MPSHNTGGGEDDGHKGCIGRRGGRCVSLNTGVEWDLEIYTALMLPC